MRVLGLAMNPPTFYRAQLLVLSGGTVRTKVSKRTGTIVCTFPSSGA